MLPPVRLLALLAGVALLGACTGLFSSAPEPAPEELRFRDALQALEQSDFRGAEAGFRQVASRCESGTRGRSALLFLSTLALDARNPWKDPDRAAGLAAAYLKLPDPDPEGLALARSLYLLAVDLGAEPRRSDAGTGEGADPPYPDLAARFSNCSGGGVVERIRPLPDHPGPRTAARLEAALARADSLRHHADSLAKTLGAARARIQELEAELERIRELLKGGAGGPGPLRP